MFQMSLRSHWKIIFLFMIACGLSAANGYADESLSNVKDIYTSLSDRDERLQGNSTRGVINSGVINSGVIQGTSLSEKSEQSRNTSILTKGEIVVALWDIGHFAGDEANNAAAKISFKQQKLAEAEAVALLNKYKVDVWVAYDIDVHDPRTKYANQVQMLAHDAYYDYAIWQQMGDGTHRALFSRFSINNTSGLNTFNTTVIQTPLGNLCVQLGEVMTKSIPKVCDKVWFADKPALARSSQREDEWQLTHPQFMNAMKVRLLKFRD